MRNRLLLLLTLLIVFPAALLAEEFTGRVTDPKGAVVTKANVTIHNIDTGVDIKTMTTSTGDYAVPYMKPGHYEIYVEAAGFKKETRTNLELQTDQTRTVNFVLTVGAVSEFVTVAAESAVIDTSTAETGEVIEKMRVTEEPINGRNPIMLSIYSAGVTFTGGNTSFIRPFDQPNQYFQINGGQNGQNEASIDGGGNDSGIGGQYIAYVPPVDSVAEFKIITSPYDAQYGRSGGGVIDISLKSGTNKIHGDAYEFARRSWLDANTWQDDYNYARGQAFNFPKHSLDQYGVEFDGPVVAPKIYNGRDKSFFEAQWEHWHEVKPQIIVATVPDPAWLTGDFSNLSYATSTGFNPITIYDPLTIHLDPSTGQYIRNPFPGNKIPTNRIDPTAAKFLSFFPAPNTTPPSNQTQWQNNYTNPSPILDNYNNGNIKLDYNMTAMDRFTLRYSFYERFEDYPTSGLPSSSPAYQGLMPWANHNQQFASEWVHTFSANRLFDLKAHLGIVANHYNYAKVYNENNFWPTSETQQFNGADTYFPCITFNSFASLGGWGPGFQVAHDLFILPTFTWIKGHHSMHTGVDVRLMQNGTTKPGGQPQLSSSPQWTQANYNYGDANSGNDIASMMLGTMSGGNDSFNATNFWMQSYFAPFVQDDWKVNKRLTLNLGVRWDFTPGPYERHNRSTGVFDLNMTNPINSQVNLAALPGGVVKGGVTYLGVGGQSRSLYSMGIGDIQPRFGFAYSLNNKTVVRGGFGERFRGADTTTPGGNPMGYSANTPYISSLDGGKTPLDNLSDPWPFVIQPTDNSLGALEGLGTGFNFVPKGYKIYNVWNFSAGIQRELSSRDTLEVDYVGSRTYNLDSSYADNMTPTSYTDACNLQMGNAPDNCNNDWRRNPFYGVAAFEGSNDYSWNDLQGSQLLTPYPAFGWITETRNTGSSWYNAMQATFNHRLQQGLTAHATYTWSKNMDQIGYADQAHNIISRTIDGNDRTNATTISLVYQVPVGKGREFLGSSNRLVDAAVGGWEIGNLMIFQTGTPWAPPQQYVGNAHMDRTIDPTTGYIRGLRPCASYWTNNPPAGATILKTVGAWSDVPYAISDPQQGGSSSCNGTYNFQNTPPYGVNFNTVYSGIRIPGYAQWDANMMKTFSATERFKLQLRFEMFNAANHPLWQEGYSTANDKNFGTIERGNWGQSNLPRQTQIALKLMW